MSWMSEHLYRWLFLYAGNMLPKLIKKRFLGSSLLCQGEQEHGSVARLLHVFSPQPECALPELAVTLPWMWVWRPPPSSFCYLSCPARTTLMTSAVKTKERTCLLLLRALSYGRSLEDWAGEGEISGVWVWGGGRRDPDAFFSKGAK